MTARDGRSALRPSSLQPDAAWSGVGVPGAGVCGVGLIDAVVAVVVDVVAQLGGVGVDGDVPVVTVRAVADVAGGLFAGGGADVGVPEAVGVGVGVPGAGVCGVAYDDMVIAAYYDSYVTTYGGSVSIIYGPQTGALSASDADAVIHGKSSYDYLGYYRMDVYDVDGDGDDEAMIGAYSYDTSSSSVGAIGIFDAPTGNVQIDSGDYLLTGTDAYDYVGCSVGDIGDINNDGFADIGWGEPGDSVVYLMLGPVTLGTYDGALADLDGNGSLDVVVGSYTQSTFTGETYVFFDGAF